MLSTNDQKDTRGKRLRITGIVSTAKLWDIKPSK
jgi:hypothetical protein